MKFCKDCDCFRDTEWGYRCANSLGQPDPVTGHREMLPCYEERDNVNGCGPNGNNFIPSLRYQLKSLSLSNLLAKVTGK